MDGFNVNVITFWYPYTSAGLANLSKEGLDNSAVIFLDPVASHLIIGLQQRHKGVIGYQRTVKSSVC